MVLGHFGHGHFGLGSFGPDISAMDVSATENAKGDVLAIAINCGWVMELSTILSDFSPLQGKLH